MKTEEIKWSRRLLDALDGQPLLTEEAFGPEGEVDQAGVRFGYGELVKTLIARKLTIATMESCTGGQIASLLTDTEGSSEVFKGGFVTYRNEAKVAQLPVEEKAARSDYVIVNGGSAEDLMEEAKKLVAWLKGRCNG